MALFIHGAVHPRRCSSMSLFIHVAVQALFIHGLGV